MKTKIGTQVAHVTRDSDTTFKVNRSKVNLQGRGNIAADSRTSLIFINSLIFMASTAIGSKSRWAPAGVRDGLQLGRSVRAAASGVNHSGRGHAHRLFYRKATGMVEFIIWKRRDCERCDAYRPYKISPAVPAAVCTAL